MRILLTLVFLLSVSMLAHSEYGTYSPTLDRFYFTGPSYSSWTRAKEKLDSKTIYFIQLAKGGLQPFYKDERPVERLSISPTNEAIAYVRCENSQPIGVRILSLDSEILHSIDEKVQEYAWSPDGSKIAYMTGITTPEQAEPYKSNGIWIYDLSSKERLKVLDKGRGIRGINF